MPVKSPRVDLVNKSKIIKPEKEKILKLNPEKSDSKNRSKFFLIGKIFIIILAIAILSSGAYAYKVIAGASNNIIEGEGTSFLKQLSMLATSADRPLKGEADNQINFLLLGMGGDGHSGGNYLSDTIIVASFRPEAKEVAMLSIPRDLLVDIPNYYYRKINNAYAFGETDDYPGGGAALSKGIIEEVTGLTIHYWLVVDFEGFKGVVETLDGVEVCVDNSFIDYEYPDYSLGYQTVNFQEGCQKMTGETALQYARSRHGNNGEGSDFARSKRQQNVITAVKEKALTAGTYLNPNKITDILNNLGEHAKTNMELWEMAALAKQVRDINPNQIITRVIDNSANGVLHSDILENGAYVLIPNAGLGDYSEIQKMTQDLFGYAKVVSENAKIQIQNGTLVNGLAFRTQQKLENEGLNVVSIGNATLREVSQTVIYNLSADEFPITLNSLNELLEAKTETQIPLSLLTDDANISQSNLNAVDLQYSLQKDLSEQVEFLIILGNNLDDTNTNQ